MPELPRFIALESALLEKFVYFTQEDDDGDHHGALRAYGETILSPYAKFEVELARSGSANRFNIRSCYNNKYWMLSSRQNVVMITCDANEPQEDTSLRTCTLFEPFFINDSKNQNFLRFIFAFDHRYVDVNNTKQDFLGLSYTFWNQGLFTVYDWDLLYILPKYVTFKGDGGFLSARMFEDRTVLQFASDDIGDPSVGHEVFLLRDGAIRLKSIHFGRYWRRSPNWIWADSNDTTDSDIDTVFWPIRVSDNVVALRSLGNNYFCESLTLGGKTRCLNANVPTISKEARLEVHETVLSRDIYNVKFRLKDARIYGENVLLMATGDATNTSKEPNTITLRFLISQKESKNFTSSMSLKVGINTTLKAEIPSIVSSEITMSAEFEGAVKWGTASETTNDLETSYNITVPPMATMRVRVLATQGKCNVPFSYTQRDTLVNGQITTTIMNDGVYKGINCYNITYDTDQNPHSDRFDEPLPLSSRRRPTPGLII